MEFVPLGVAGLALVIAVVGLGTVFRFVRGGKKKSTE